jgi:hypothetical protein
MAENNSLPSVYTVSPPATGEKTAACKWFILVGRIKGRTYGPLIKSPSRILSTSTYQPESGDNNADSEDLI